MFLNELQSFLFIYLAVEVAFWQQCNHSYLFLQAGLRLSWAILVNPSLHCFQHEFLMQISVDCLYLLHIFFVDSLICLSWLTRSFSVSILTSFPISSYGRMNWTQRYFQYLGYFSIVFACFLQNNDLGPFLDRYFLSLDHFQPGKIQFWGYFNEKAGTIMHKCNDCQINRLTVLYDTSMHQTR